MSQNVLDFGALGDGVADDLPALLAAISGATGGSVTLPGNRTYRIGDDVAIAVGVTFEPGASISIDVGKTLTLEGVLVAPIAQIFSGLGTVVFSSTSIDRGYPQWWGAAGDGFDDDYEAVQACLTALAGRSIVITPGAFFMIDKSLSLGGRTTIQGSGLDSGFKWIPTANNQTFCVLSASGSDNPIFRDFAVNASGAATGKSGFQATSTESRLLFENVFFDGFNDYCVSHDSAQHDQFLNCRFLSTHNLAHIGTAITTSTFANRLTIQGCRFQDNDRDIVCNTAGSSVSIRDCSFELGGSLAGTFSHSILLEGVQGFEIGCNYFEGNRTSTSAGVIYLRGGSCGGSICGNQLVGDVGGITYSQWFVYCENTTGSGIQVHGNNMAEVELGFVRAGTAHTISVRNNRFVNDGSELTSYQAVVALMGNPGVIDIDRAHTFTYDPGSLGDGSGETHTESVSGASFGDYLVLASPYSLQGVLATAYVSASGTIAIRLQNETGAIVDLSSGTWKVWRTPAGS